MIVAVKKLSKHIDGGQASVLSSSSYSSSSLMQLVINEEKLFL